MISYPIPEVFVSFILENENRFFTFTSIQAKQIMSKVFSLETVSNAEDADSQCATYPGPNTFDLKAFLRAKDGTEWLKQVQVQDSNQKSFSYYAPQVAWEDIHRNNGSAVGDFIFDVTMNIKDKASADEHNVRYL